MNNYVTHLESAIDGSRLACDEIQTMHKDRPLWVRYDLEAVAANLKPEMLASRPASLWRYRELLPLPFDVAPISLGESMTPLLPVPKLASRLGMKDLWVKDESILPTASFKARGLGMAVNMAAGFGISTFAIPTAGNAGGALSAYAARAGARAFVFMPSDTPIANMHECRLAGADVYLVDGLINDCGAIVKAGKDRMGWFDVSTLKEPYRIEGKKTMGLELAEQCHWTLPDVIIYPTGGGTGLIGMWKAFQELAAMGWLTMDRMPRMISVQSDGCAPIARAFANGERFAAAWEGASTCATGIRVPVAVGDFMILDAIRDSGGVALAVEESKIERMTAEAIGLEGLAFCPEAGACVLALSRLLEDGLVRPDERVVVFNTGSAAKYYPASVPDLPRLSGVASVDFDRLAERVV